jgi:hypothetical protein
MSEPDGLRDETLSRLYRESATAQPPSRIDASILAAARAEARHGQERPPQPAWRRWRMAVSFAAVATFAFALSMIVPREMERVEREFSAETAVPAPAPASPPAPMAAPTQTQPAPKGGASAPDREAAGAPAGAVGRSAPVPPPPMREEKASRLAPAPATEPRPAPAQPLARSAERGRRQSEDSAVEANPWPGAAKAQPEEPQGVEAESRHPGVADSTTLTAPREGEMPPPAARPVPALAPRVEADKKGSSAATSMDGAGEAAPPPRGAARALKQEEAERSPAQWVAAIRRLQRQGRTEEAIDALVAFRRAYPGYALPEDLRRLEP